MEKTYKESVKVEIDDEGKMLVECPECQKEFKAPYESVKAEKATIVCPHCNKELSKITLTKKDREKAVKQVIPKIKEDVIKDLKKAFKNFR